MGVSNRLSTVTHRHDKLIQGLRKYAFYVLHWERVPINPRNPLGKLGDWL